MISISIYSGGVILKKYYLPVGFHLGVALSYPYATILAALRGSALRRHFWPEGRSLELLFMFLVSRAQ